MDRVDAAMPGVQTEGRVTRSQSKVREKYAPFSNYPAIRELKNSSHASVSLLTPRVKSHSQQENDPPKRSSLVPRRTSILAIEQARVSSSPVAMDIDDLITPKVSQVNKQVFGAFNFAKENEAARKNTDKTTTMNRRRSSITNTLKPSSGLDPMSVCKPGLKSVMRARQVHEDLEKGGDEGSGSRIMVYVRLRPLSKKEKESGARSCVKIDNNRDVYLTELALENDYLRLKRLRGRHFAFDAAFPDNTSQQEVYNTSTANLVEGVLDGRNASVFCYGATGAGKTHTMLGTVQHPGVMVLALKDLFAKLKRRNPEGQNLVRLSYLEVYNETVRDLLSPGRALVLREDSKQSGDMYPSSKSFEFSVRMFWRHILQKYENVKLTSSELLVLQGILAAGLTQFEASSTDEVMTLLHKGNTNRQTEPTRANETSSRSHAILQVVVEYKVRQESGVVLRVGKLSLIDLAGSERALATDQRTLRSVEGANINRSLLALSSCINALVEGKSHIPFRNSKLTQLLKDSLGGSCQTAMIANLSPSNGSFGETQNTLHWADRAKEIRTKGSEAREQLQVPESQDEQTKMLLQMQKENQLLRLHLARLEQKCLLNNGVNSTRATPSSTPFTPMFGPNRTYPGEPLPQVETLAHLEQKYWATNGMNATPSSTPFTPVVSVVPAIRTYPGEPLPQVETLAKRGEAKTVAEKKIWELQRTVELLEMEAEKSRRDSAMREEKMNASILALTRDHSMQLKRKDELIRNLMNPETPIPAPEVVDSPMKCLEKILKQRAVDSTSKAAVAAEKERTTVKAMRHATPKVGTSAGPMQSSARSALPKQEQTVPRATRRTTRNQPPQSPVKTPSKTSPVPKYLSSMKAEELNSCRKRTFWDITNSPSDRNKRVTSHLLQPGFARRRTSPEQD